MRIGAILLFALAFAVLSAHAQRIPSDIETILLKEAGERRMAQMAEDQRRRSVALDNLRRENERRHRPESADKRIRLDRIKEFYRFPSEQEGALLAPDSGDVAKYAKFLAKGKAGLIKIMPDFGCDEMSLQKTFSQKCESFTMPGGGSGFSFRVKNHRPWRFSDIVFDGQHFIAFGELSQGFMTRLSDRPIDEVNLNSEGSKFLMDFVPATEFEAVSTQNLSFVNGRTEGNFTYGKVFPVAEVVVYILRSIAYRGDVSRTFEGVSYNELDFDKRLDIVVAFQVVRRSSDGSITLLWKELQRKDSPRMTNVK